MAITVNTNHIRAGRLILESDNSEPMPKPFLDAFLSKEPVMLTIADQAAEALVVEMSANGKKAVVQLLSALE